MTTATSDSKFVLFNHKTHQEIHFADLKNLLRFAKFHGMTIYRVNKNKYSTEKSEGAEES